MLWLGSTFTKARMWGTMVLVWVTRGARNECPLMFNNNLASTHSALLFPQQEHFTAGQRRKKRRTWSPCVFLLFTIWIQLKYKSPECVHCPLTCHVPNFWFALPSRDSGFSDVSFSDEEVIDFPGFVHVYLDECSCLCQSQASLLVTLIQQSRLIL